MKTFFIAAFSALVLFSSCSTYRGTQTPDDTYFASSPNVARGGGNAGNNEYVPANSNRNEGRYSQSSSYSGYDDYATADDRWLMMRVRDRSRWSVFDDYNYYSPYNDFAYGGLGGYGVGYYPYGYAPGVSMGFGSGFYNPYYSFGLGLGYGGFGSGYFNNYYNWNSMYNPYFYNGVVVNPKVNPAGYTTLRNFNMGGYNNRNYNTSARGNAARPNLNGYVAPGNAPSRVYYNNNGNSGRNTYSNSNNSTLNNGGSNRSYDRPVRTYAPSNNSSYTPSRSSGYSGGNSGGGYSGGNSGGGGGAAGSRPSRR